MASIRILRCHILLACVASGIVWRYCVLVERDLAAKPLYQPLPFLDRCSAAKTFITQYRQLRRLIFSGYFMFVRNDLIDARVVYSILGALARALIDRRAFKREAFILTIGQKSTKLTCVRRICSFFFFFYLR